MSDPDIDPATKATSRYKALPDGSMEPETEGTLPIKSEHPNFMQLMWNEFTHKPLTNPGAKARFKKRKAALKRTSASRKQNWR